jgi:hypothetical protein
MDIVLKHNQDTHCNECADFEQIWWPHNTMQDYLTHIL